MPTVDEPFKLNRSHCVKMIARVGRHLAYGLFNMNTILYWLLLETVNELLPDTPLGKLGIVILSSSLYCTEPGVHISLATI